MGRLLAPLALAALAAALLAPAAAPAAIRNASWCSIEPTPPCIQSASVDGAPVAPDHPRWDVLVSAVQDEERGFLWTAVRKTAGGFDTALGPESLDDTWVVTFDAGTAVPRIVSALGRPGPVARAPQPDGTHRVTVTATPVVSGGDCDHRTWPWRCPSAATPEKVGALGGDVGDFGAWQDAAQQRAIHGLNLATNIPATSLPPEIAEDSATGARHLLLRLAGPHFRADGATLFRGFLHLRIPAAFLRELYGIDDLATLTGGGVTTEVGGARTGAGSASIAQEPGGGALLVDISDMTFSARTVRGPGPPRDADPSDRRAGEPRRRHGDAEVPRRPRPRLADSLLRGALRRRGAPWLPARVRPPDDPVRPRPGARRGLPLPGPRALARGGRRVVGLLPQPHGFEGAGPRGAVGDADGLTVAQEPDLPEAPGDAHAASLAAAALVDVDGDRVLVFDDLPDVVAPVVERAHPAGEEPPHGVGSARRGGEVGAADLPQVPLHVGGEDAPHLVRRLQGTVEVAPHDLHVLPRHRAQCSSGLG
ncbi:MAG TPA: hypothetical protein VNB64_01890 [Solirubrobacteraceae bacterium]|nr:hypothetical protein [Solirubrobacteraceae bacterium]